MRDDRSNSMRCAPVDGRQAPDAAGASEPRALPWVLAGFALFLVAMDFMVWGRAFSLPAGHDPFGVDEIRLFYSVPNTVSLGLALLAPLVVSRRALHVPGGARRAGVAYFWGGLTATVASIVALGLLCVLNCGSLALLLVVSVVAGSGLGLALLAWQAAFALVDPAALMKTVLGACVAFPVVAIVTMQLPRVTEYALMVAAALASFWMLARFARTVSGPEAAEPFDDGTQTGESRDASGPDAPRARIAVALARELLASWAPTVLCLGSLGFVTGVSRTLTLDAVSDSTTLAVESLLCFLAVALLLAVMWRVRGSSVSPVVFYQVAFPVVATGLVAFAVVASDFTALFAGLSYFFFEFALIIAIVHNVQQFCGRPERAVAAYGLVTGCAYLMLGAGTVLGFCFQQMRADSGLPVFTIVIIVCIYALSLPLVFQARRRAAEELHGAGRPAGPAAPSDEPAAEPAPPAADLRDAIERQVRTLADRYGLTPREAQILGLVLTGFDTPAMAERMGVSENTVRTHKKNLYRKLDVHSKQDIVAMLAASEDAPATGCAL